MKVMFRSAIWTVVLVAANSVLCTTVEPDPLIAAVRKRNFDIEVHHVTTEDGYILSMYHMPPKRKLATNGSNVMVFAHGLLGSAGQFVSCRKGKSAAFYFAEQGYDIWLGNSRGTYFAQTHKALNSSDAKYWQFSWHEIGVYDLAAQIDYVLEKTKQKKISLVGHSQGTTAGLVLLAERPEYNDKVLIFHAMTPPAIMRHFNKLFLPLVNNRELVMHFLENFGIYDLAPHAFLAPIVKVLGNFCEEPQNIQLCNNGLSLVMGRAAPQSWYPEIVSDLAIFHPASCGYLQLLHYGQLAASGKFQKYDHGIQKNLELYGSRYPPTYNLSNIRTKVHILHGTNDLLVLEKNIPILMKLLRNAEMIESEFPSFNHFDFAFGQQIEKVHRAILKAEKLVYLRDLIEKRRKLLG